MWRAVALLIGLAIRAGAQPYTAPDVSGRLITPSDFNLLTAAVARVDARVFDVRAYGALCDGSTNDATAIQAAATACSTASTGGFINIPDLGTDCVISTGITIPGDNCRIGSLGGSGTLRLNAAVTHVLTFKTTGSNRGNGGGVANLWIDGNNLLATDGAGIYISNWHAMEIANVYMRDMGNAGGGGWGVIMKDDRALSTGQWIDYIAVRNLDVLRGNDTRAAKGAVYILDDVTTTNTRVSDIWLENIYAANYTGDVVLVQDAPRVFGWGINGTASATGIVPTSVLRITASAAITGNMGESVIDGVYFECQGDCDASATPYAVILQTQTGATFLNRSNAIANINRLSTKQVVKLEENAATGCTGATCLRDNQVSIMKQLLAAGDVARVGAVSTSNLVQALEYHQLRGAAFADLDTGGKFAALPAGTYLYCSNCTPGAVCVGGGGGAWALKTATAWTCGGGGVASVLDFGAVGDGVTDNCPIWAVIDAATPSTGIRLRFPAGTYQSTCPFKLRSQSVYEGDGAGATLLRTPTTGDGFPLMQVATPRTCSGGSGGAATCDDAVGGATRGPACVCYTNADCQSGTCAGGTVARWLSVRDLELAPRTPNAGCIDFALVSESSIQNVYCVGDTTNGEGGTYGVYFSDGGGLVSGYSNRLENSRISQVNIGVRVMDRANDTNLAKNVFSLDAIGVQIDAQSNAVKLWGNLFQSNGTKGASDTGQATVWMPNRWEDDSDNLVLEAGAFSTWYDSGNYHSGTGANLVNNATDGRSLRIDGNEVGSASSGGVPDCTVDSSTRCLAPQKSIPVSDAPRVCGSDARGQLYFDLSLNELCFCNATNWCQADGGGCTSSSSCG